MKRQSNDKSITRTASLLLALTAGLSLSVSLSACVAIQSSVIGPTSGKGSTVSSIDSDYGILRLTKPEGLTSRVNSGLVSQCPSGLLTDVHTQLWMRDWFLIVQYYTLVGNAVCKPPPPPIPPPTVSLPAAQPHIVLRGVHFDFNKANIRPGDSAVLDEAAATLKNSPNVVVDVNGYCDSVGGDEYNLRLSERRAAAVVDYLEKQGIARDKLMAHGYGKTDFVATNETSEGRAQNRRVELVPGR